MATFTYNFDTRVITVDSPDTTITLQELLNSVADEMDDLNNMDDDLIARWSGKDPLGLPGENTGITLTLLNGWKLNFAEFTPGPVSAIVTGGNLLAQEQDGTAALTPIISGVNVATIAQASSATFSEAQANKQLQYQIESLQRRTYRQTGDTFYVDPVNGDNANDGLLPERPFVGSLRGPKATFAAAFALVTSGQHDGIYFVQSTAGASTILDEIIVIDKEDVQIRGPGPGFVIRSTSAVSRPVTITGDHVEFTGVSILPVAGGGLSGVACTGAEPYLHHLRITNSNAEGVTLAASSDHFIVDAVDIDNCVGKAIHVLGAPGGHVCGGRLHDCSHGIHLDALGGTINGQCLIDDILIYDHTTKGVLIDSGFEQSFVDASALFTGNGTGQPGGVNPLHDVENNEPTTAVLLKAEDITETLNRNARFIEHLHGTHTWQSASFYVDPVNGRDDWDGSRRAPFQTIQAAVDATTNNNHDVIFLLATDSGITETDEAVIVNKNYVFIRGPGRDFRLKNTSPGDVLTITGEGVEVASFRVQGAASGTGRGIVATGELVLVENLHMERAKGDAIVLSGISNGVVRDCLINGRSGGPLVNEGNGIVVEGAATNSYNRIFDNRIMGVGGDGIVVGATINDTMLERNTIHDGDGWGISIASGTNGTIVRHNHFSNNALGAWTDLSGLTDFENNEQWATAENLANLHNLQELAPTTVAAGTTTTVVNTTRTEADGYWDNSAILVTADDGTKITRAVSSYVSANGAFTLDSALPFTPSTGNLVALLSSGGSGSGGGGGGLTATQATQLLEVWQLLGLDIVRPLTVTRTQRSVGSEIIQRIVELTGGTVTITRQ
jgi:parallel beta-helix repeat protein